MSLDKRGPEAIRAAVRRLMAAVQRPAVDVTVKRRDVELLLLSRVELGPVQPPVNYTFHPNQQ